MNNITEFLQRFPNNEVCLETIFNKKYGEMSDCPKCKTKGVKFYKVKNRQCYECGKCGHQLYPLAGTIMHGTTTDLTKWFYAIYLFSTSKNGISSNELKRQLGVTYKCAWRIGHKIRELMELDEIPLSGDVELDESLIGGSAPGKRGWGADNKTCIFGMMERGGRGKIVVVPNRTREVLYPIILKNVEKGATVHTDEFRVYKSLPQFGYKHRNVVHSRRQWIRNGSHINSIEGYWSNLKKSILGTHTFVTPRHLHKYLNEFSFRHNHRKEGDVFESIIE